MNLRKKLLAFGAALLFSGAASAALVPGLPSVTFTLTRNEGGVLTSTTYTMDGTSSYALAYQLVQMINGAAGAQAVSNGAGATCISSPENASPVNVSWDRQPPIPNVTTDWSISRLTDPRDQAILSVVPTTGAVYRNAIRLGNATVSKLCLYGDIYGKGKTSGTWFRWDAPTKAWVAVPLDRDATILD